ncbi:hypothetical protein [uncultured Ottowia sp.]|uniref:hypothetical protein n=1 Tax=uncultured Ottowia sp. TaxID=543067 RepID=UPI0025985C25|nr:hypothetical protein [uncultured Ottowia sp.]
MAKFSTGLRQAMVAGGGILNALNGGRLRIFCAASDPSNPQTSAVDAPMTADAAETGTLMLELTAGGDGVTGLTLAAVGGGLLKKQDGQTWLCANVLHSGPINYWRFVAPGDTAGASQTEARIQGTIGITRGDMLVSGLEVSQGASWILNHFDIEAPASNDAGAP